MSRRLPLKGALATIAACRTDAAVVLVRALRGGRNRGHERRLCNPDRSGQGRGISPVPSSAVGFVVAALLNYLAQPPRCVPEPLAIKMAHQYCRLDLWSEFPARIYLDGPRTTSNTNVLGDKLAVDPSLAPYAGNGR